MRVSKLIKELEKIKKERGDLDVYCDDCGKKTKRAWSVGVGLFGKHDRHVINMRFVNLTKEDYERTL